MFEAISSLIVNLVAEKPWILVAVVLLMAAGSLIGLGVIVNRRRIRAIGAALRDSTRASLGNMRLRGAMGFSARLTPAPEPFAELTVDFTAATRFSPLDVANQLLRGRRQELRLAGRLSAAPPNELLWAKGHLPDRAVGRGPMTELWMEKRLDFIHGAYGLHGPNVSALDHAFCEMQRRFGAFVHSISVLDDSSTHVVIMLRMYGFNSEEIPALIASLRSLARAALIA
jgi:hypothetical protein